MPESLRPARDVQSRASSWRLIGISLLLVAVIAACTVPEAGGQKSEPDADFAVTLVESSAEIEQGAAAQVSGLLTPLAGFDGTVGVTVSGEGASGITVAPAELTVTGTEPLEIELTVSVAADVEAQDYALTFNFSSDDVAGKSVPFALTVLQTDDSEAETPGEGEPGEDEPGEGEPGEDEPGEGEPGEDEPGESEPEPETEPEPMDFATAMDLIGELNGELTVIGEDLATPPLALTLLTRFAMGGLILPGSAPELTPTNSEPETVLLPRGLWSSEWVEDTEYGGWWQELTYLDSLPGTGEFEMDLEILEWDENWEPHSGIDASLLIDWEHDGQATEFLELDDSNMEFPRHTTAMLEYEGGTLADLELQLDPVVHMVECALGGGVTDAYSALSLTKLLLNGSLGSSGADFFVNLIEAGFEVDETLGQFTSSGELEMHYMSHDFSLDWDATLSSDTDLADLIYTVGCAADLELPLAELELRSTIGINARLVSLDVNIAVDPSANTIDAKLVVILDETGSFEVSGTIDLTDEYPLASLDVFFADSKYTIDEFLAAMESTFGN